VKSTLLSLFIFFCVIIYCFKKMHKVCVKIQFFVCQSHRPVSNGDQVDPVALLTEDNHKNTCLALLTNLEVDSSQFKLGISQVFFRAGVLGRLEDQRDKKLNSLIVKLQSNCRRFLCQKSAEKRRVQDSAIRCIQKNVRISFTLGQWKWWKLYTQLLPIISVQNTETLFKQCKEELDEFRRKNERLVTEKNNFQVLNQQLENKVCVFLVYLL
jgi:myosin-18